MRPTPLREYRIPARHIAELAWGRGGTTGYLTTRRGAYYYSCSGHGGYVVDSRCLTKQERRKLNRYTRPWPLRVLVQHRNGGGDAVIGVDCREFISCGTRTSFRNRTYRYCPTLGPVEWLDMPVYLFEEDCDWAILEKLTNICCANDLKMPEGKRRQRANATFRHWIRPRSERTDLGS